MGKKLLAIVGAGASKEFNLPIGKELKRKIADLLRTRVDDWNHREGGDRYILGAIREHIGSVGEGRDSLQACFDDMDHMCEAMSLATSIDHFINDQGGRGFIEIIGKLAITRAILQSEKTSVLYGGKHEYIERINFSFTEGTWLTSFARIITQGCKLDGLAERFSQIGLIVFNYDRCIEHFLFHWLQTYFKVDREHAASLISNLDIYHPYGAVGKLLWQDREQGVRYGDLPHSGKLLELASRIKTFTEGTDPDSSEICSIRELVANSEKVVFLGFAYHKLNLDLLRGETRSKSMCKEVYGTALGISDFDIAIIRHDLAELFGCADQFVQMRNNLTCFQLFDEFNRGLSIDY